MDMYTWLFITRARVLNWAMRGIVRRRLRTASPEKSQRIEQLFADAEAMRHNGQTIQKRLDINSAEVLEAMVNLHREYEQYAPGCVEPLERHLETRRAMEAEATYLSNLRESAGENAEKAVALIQDYCDSHPNSRLGKAHLMGALASAGRINDASALCQPEDFPNEQYQYHITLGNLLLQKKDWNGAIAQANLAQKFLDTAADREIRQLQSISPHILMASALAGKGNTAKARKIFDRCLRATLDKSMREAIQASRIKAGL